MANPNPTFKKKPRLSLVTFVWLLSLLLLLIRLIWVLPAAFDHHNSKKAVAAPCSEGWQLSKPDAASRKQHPQPAPSILENS